LAGGVSVELAGGAAVVLGGGAADGAGGGAVDGAGAVGGVRSVTDADGAEGGGGAGSKDPLPRKGLPLCESGGVCCAILSGAANANTADANDRNRIRIDIRTVPSLP